FALPRHRQKRLPPFSAVADNASGVPIRPDRFSPESSGDGGWRATSRGRSPSSPAGDPMLFAGLSRPENSVPPAFSQFAVGRKQPVACVLKQSSPWYSHLRHNSVSIENLQQSL